MGLHMDACYELFISPGKIDVFRCIVLNFASK